MKRIPYRVDTYLFPNKYLLIGDREGAICWSYLVRDTYRIETWNRETVNIISNILLGETMPLDGLRMFVRKP